MPRKQSSSGGRNIVDLSEEHQPSASSSSPAAGRERRLVQEHASNAGRTVVIDDDDVMVTGVRRQGTRLGSDDDVQITHEARRRPPSQHSSHARYGGSGLILPENLASLLSSREFASALARALAPPRRGRRPRDPADEYESDEDGDEYGHDDYDDDDDWGDEEDELEDEEQEYWDYEDLLTLADRLGEAKPRGLTPSVILALPRRRYRLRGPDRPACTICMHEFDEQVTLITLDCTHEFHEECAQEWFGRSGTCPICRAAVWPFGPDNPVTL